MSNSETHLKKDVNLELDPRDPSPQRTIEKVVDLTSQTRNTNHKNFLIQKLESIYKNLADQDVGDEILLEFDEVLTSLKNTKL